MRWRDGVDEIFRMNMKEKERKDLSESKLMGGGYFLLIKL